jgi:UDPglucose 6-dehydrogenase
MKDYKVIINKSTVPVGTAERTKKAIAKNATVEFDVVLILNFYEKVLL